MPRIALVVVFSIALASPVAAQTQGESADRPDRNDEPRSVIVVPTAVTVSPRPPAAPGVTRTRRSFTVPWFTGVYQ